MVKSILHWFLVYMTKVTEANDFTYFFLSNAIHTESSFKRRFDPFNATHHSIQIYRNHAGG